MLYTDTDSYIQEFVYNDQKKDEPLGDLYKDMFEIVDHLDLHEYPLDHPFYKHLNTDQMKVALMYRTENKKCLGKFSDEIVDTFISEYAALRSKVYSIKTTSGIELKKCGGTSIIRSMESFNFDLYKQVVFKEKLAIYTNQKRLASSKHQMFLKSIVKKSFNCFCDKRFLLSDGINTLAHGHFEIEAVKQLWHNDLNELINQIDVL